MRIAVTADPFIPVPPIGYGGIERIIDFLVSGLAERGHEVLLIAHPDSKADVELWKYPSAGISKMDHLKNTALIYGLKKWKPDVIHSFSRLAYLLPLLPSGIPKLMSYQREPTLSQVKLASGLSKKGSLSFSGCSNYISDQIKPYAPSFTVYNGVPAEIYKPTLEFNEDAPLVFLGRIEWIKGTHIAIDVAKSTGNKLVIAGNIPTDERSKKYFETEVEPHIDNDQISYIGVVNDAQKNELLRNAKAFLMPILWNEPFGIVMAEAMACGTPVIGFSRGSVPEVVNTGISGFKVDSPEEMIQAVQKIHEIDRSLVVKEFNDRFSADRIVEEYLKLYQQICR